MTTDSAIRTTDIETDKFDSNDLESDPHAVETVEPEPANTPRRGTRRRWSMLLGALVVIASAAAAGFLYATQYREDLATDKSATAAAVQAATDGAVAVLSYQPDTIEADLTAAQSHLTGEFLTYYTDFSEQVLKPAAKDRAVSTQVTVVGAADTEIGPDTAKVLVFVNQSTVSRDRPEPAQSASSVMVSLAKVDGRWLISAFEPI